MNTTKQTLINLPLTDIKPLYRNDKEQTLIVEVKIKALKNNNDPDILDAVINQARLDYALGDYKSFDNADDLIQDLSV